MIYKRIFFQKIKSEGVSGSIIPIELCTDNHNFPFEVKRIYFICEPQKPERGNHAHFDLEQVIICTKGSFVLHLDDGMGNTEDIEMNSNNEGIYIKDLKWRVLKNFSDDCIISVLASEEYDEKDYIRDYNDFLRIVRLGMKKA